MATLNQSESESMLSDQLSVDHILCVRLFLSVCHSMNETCHFLPRWMISSP